MKKMPQGLNFGLFFFGVNWKSTVDQYQLVLDLAATSDRAGLKFVSLPERHFHPFGGAFPAPSVLSAALAQVTKQLQLRAGSVITPLHDVVRVVEEWSVVDNLSDGRVGLSLGSGWSVNDFVLALSPDAFKHRREIVRSHVEELRHLWSGGSIERPNAAGQPFSFSIFPPPVQKVLPLWLTAGGSEETFIAAGRLGVNVLTHLERQSLETLEQHITKYRLERERCGHDPDKGIVTLMQHTFIHDDDDNLREIGRDQLTRYIAASLSLETRNVKTGGAMSSGSPVLPFKESTDTDHEIVVTAATDRYLKDSCLIGTIEECRARGLSYLQTGVNEIACLVDFIDNDELIKGGLNGIVKLQEQISPEALQRRTDEMVARFNEI